MTVLVQNPVNTYVSAGLPTFIYSFQILSANHLVVLVNGATKILGADYSVTGVGNQSGGTITGLSTTAGDAVVLKRVVPLERTTDYQENGDLLAKVLNPDFDLLWQALQQIDEVNSRSLHIPADETTIDVELEPAATRANRLLSFDSNGKPITVSPVEGTATALSVALAASSGAGLMGVLPEGTNSVPTTVQKALRLNVSATAAGALFDGVTDDTAAINKVILDLATRSPNGGLIKCPSGKTAKINGPILIPSNIKLDLNGCSLVGQGNTVGVMFETAYLSGGALISNVGTAYQSHVIKNAKIFNGYVYNVGKMCNFQNFNHGCSVHDVELNNARQVGVLDACFYAAFKSIFHSAGTDISLPSFHFKSANNNIKLQKVITTSAYCYLFEGGSSCVTLDECSTEGGELAIKVKGDLLGLKITGHYAEALMKFLDLTEAGVVKFDVSGNYFNYVDVLLDDGGSTTAGPQISGVWDDTNFIGNVGGTTGGITYRGRMQISAQQNLALYRLQSNSGFGITATPTNWITSKNSNVEFLATITATSISDYRQKTKVPGTSIVAPYRVGDTGPVYPGSVFFSTVTMGATTTIDTQIAWQPDSLFAKFVFTAQDGNGLHHIYGDIFGAYFKRHDADAMVMSIANNSGFLRISLTQTVAPFNQVTGSVQICA